MVILDSFRKLPKWMLICHVMAKLVVGLGIGILLAPYLDGLGWWLIVAALIAALPAKFKMVDAYRTMSDTRILLAGLAALLFGAGLGLIFIVQLHLYGWWLIGMGIILTIPAVYKMLTNK